jgi:hypothetical protein
VQRRIQLSLMRGLLYWVSRLFPRKRREQTLIVLGSNGHASHGATDDHDSAIDI